MYWLPWKDAAAAAQLCADKIAALPSDAVVTSNTKHLGGPRRMSHMNHMYTIWIIYTGSLDHMYNYCNYVLDICMCSVLFFYLWGPQFRVVSLWGDVGYHPSDWSFSMLKRKIGGFISYWSFSMLIFNAYFQCLFSMLIFNAYFQ